MIRLCYFLVVHIFSNQFVAPKTFYSFRSFHWWDYDTVRKLQVRCSETHYLLFFLMLVNICRKQLDGIEHVLKVLWHLTHFMTI